MHALTPKLSRSQQRLLGFRPPLWCGNTRTADLSNIRSSRPLLLPDKAPGKGEETPIRNHAHNTCRHEIQVGSALHAGSSPNGKLRERIE